MKQRSLFDDILDNDNLDEFYTDPDYAAPAEKPPDDPEHQVPHTAAEFNKFQQDYRARVSESNRRWAMSS